ncbi:hypothetical protein [Hydrocarboniphaga sp.]|uniref:hypothetical protein n=1 Tax=Hydrocarboniphaga sp. TaxID=2033016 RepID=UPI003D11683B
MFVALLAGFCLVFSMVGGISLSPLPIVIDYVIPGSAAGWRMVHLGMMMNGMMALLLGCVLDRCDATDRSAALVGWGTIIAVWGNFCFYLFGMFAPNHGVSLQDNPLGAANWAGTLAFFPALIGAITLMMAVIVLLRSNKAP